MIPRGAIPGREAEGDTGADLLERRWFASAAAARAKQAECEALLEVVALAKASWRVSRAELVKLEALRDALGEQVAGEVSERPAIRGSTDNGGTANIWSAA